MAALGVAGAMKAKVKLGMAYNYHEKKQINSRMISCLKKLKKKTENSLKLV